MRPTFSIIFFTVASGAGYGLLMLVALASLLLWPEAHDPDPGSWPTLLAYGLGIGFLLVSSGLVSSLGHLGQPQRAWRAFSQWRTSWLSREGVAAILTYLPLIGIAIALFHDGWMVPEALLAGESEIGLWMSSPTRFAASILLVAGSLATIYCTANIYACLKPIRAWNNRYVAVVYLLLGIYSGGLWAWVLTTLPHGRISDLPTLLTLLIALGFAGAILKVLYWRFLDSTPDMDAGDATGLKSMGSVRSFEQPHTEENYLTHEMGFRLARKHSRKLRVICLLAGFGIPAVLALLSCLAPSLNPPAAWIALFSGMLGIVVERWLFFAEARHMVMLYYGARND